MDGREGGGKEYRKRMIRGDGERGVALMLVGWRLEEFAGQVWAPWKQVQRYQAGPVDTVGASRSQAGAMEVRSLRLRKCAPRYAGIPRTDLTAGCGLVPVGVV
jgi:hypothetical protein